MELYQKTASELAALLHSRTVSAVEVTDSMLAHIEATEPMIDAFLCITKEEAKKAAKEADRRFANGMAAPLTGIPVGIKDNISTKGIPTTCASRILESYKPVFDATVIYKLREQGSVLAGKLNMDEFAMGATCENSWFKPSKNPWDTTRVPGGSSGGSAAAVAACEVPLALGTDTGGSVRNPASYCGLVGLKPSYGAVSRFGLVAFASSLDQIGIMARCVEDAGLLFGCISGADKSHDATSIDCGYMGVLPDAVKGLRIGVPKEYYAGGIHGEVRGAVLDGIKQLEVLGAEVTELSMPLTGYALPVYHIISSAEVSSNLARFDGVKYGFSVRKEGGTLEEMYLATRSEGFGHEVKRRILLGTHVLSGQGYDAYYRRAKQMQGQIAAEFAAAFESCDLLVTPTTPYTARLLKAEGHSPAEEGAADMCTAAVNIAGLPAVSVPCGFDKNGLPIGMQLIGPKCSESLLLGTAKAYETVVGGFRVKGVDA